MALTPELPLTVGRYALYDEIASGGMATVHVGRLLGASGFARTVAIKRLHPQYAKDPEFNDMFMDEARLAARIQHPNVVQTLDVVFEEGELFLVMEYVAGESLSSVLRRTNGRGTRVPPPIASAIVSGVLRGLHAAHRATTETGAPLNLVHRDVSPQNVLVGVDGVARVLDFGVAKAAGRSHATREGQIKGKLSYMAPEQLRTQSVNVQSDIWGAAVVLWEVLAGRRLFSGETEAIVFGKVLEEPIPRIGDVIEGVPAALDEVVRVGLARDPRKRYASAEEMAVALEQAERPALPADVSAWIEKLCGDTLATRAARVASIESDGEPARASMRPAMGEAVRELDAVPTLVSSSKNVEHVRPPEKPRTKVAFIAAALAVLATVVVVSVMTHPKPTAPATLSPATASPPSALASEVPPPERAPEPAPTASTAPSADTMSPRHPPPSHPSRAPGSRKSAPRIPDRL